MVRWGIVLVNLAVMSCVTVGCVDLILGRMMRSVLVSLFGACVMCIGRLVCAKVVSMELRPVILSLTMVMLAIVCFRRLVVLCFCGEVLLVVCVWLFRNRF